MCGREVRKKIEKFHWCKTRFCYTISNKIVHLSHKACVRLVKWWKRQRQNMKKKREKMTEYCVESNVNLWCKHFSSFLFLSFFCKLLFSNFLLSFALLSQFSCKYTEFEFVVSRIFQYMAIILLNLEKRYKLIKIHTSHFAHLWIEMNSKITFFAFF